MSRSKRPIRNTSKKVKKEAKKCDTKIFKAIKKTTTMKRLRHSNMKKRSTRRSSTKERETIKRRDKGKNIMREITMENKPNKIKGIKEVKEEEEDRDNITTPISNLNTNLRPRMTRNH